MDNFTRYYNKAEKFSKISSFFLGMQTAALMLYLLVFLFSGSIFLISFYLSFLWISIIFNIVFSRLEYINTDKMIKAINEY